MVSGNGEGPEMKKVFIKVVPNAKKNRIVEELSRLKVYVTAPAVDGKANKALIESLADHFGIKKKDISILFGEKSRDKIIGITSVIPDLLKPR